MEVEHLEQQTMLEEKEIKTAKHNCIFGRIWRFFFRERQQILHSDSPVSLVLVQHGIPFGLLPPDLINYIYSLHLLEYTVIVKELPPKIKCEGICYHLHFEGKQLKWQECLQLQSEYVEKKTIFSQRIDLSVQLIDDNLLCNLLNQS